MHGLPVQGRRMGGRMHCLTIRCPAVRILTFCFFLLGIGRLRQLTLHHLHFCWVCLSERIRTWQPQKAHSCGNPEACKSLAAIAYASNAITAPTTA
jgi:hypothetical protein